MIRATHHPLVLVLLAATVILAPGCGVIFGYGSPQEVKVVALGPDRAPIDGLKIADQGRILDQTTPGPVFLHPKENHSISIADERYYSGQHTVKKSVRVDVVILDALTLGIGLLVDSLSGSLYALEPQVTLNINTKEAVAKARAEASKPTPSAVGKPKEPTKEDGIWVTHFVTGERVFIPKGSKPCDVCGGLRGDMTPCPHCGVKEE